MYLVISHHLANFFFIFLLFISKEIQIAWAYVFHQNSSWRLETWFNSDDTTAPVGGKLVQIPDWNNTEHLVSKIWTLWAHRVILTSTNVSHVRKCGHVNVQLLRCPLCPPVCISCTTRWGLRFKVAKSDLQSAVLQWCRWSIDGRGCVPPGVNDACVNGRYQRWCGKARWYFLLYTFSGSLLTRNRGWRGWRWTHDYFYYCFPLSLYVVCYLYAIFCMTSVNTWTH